MIDKRHFALIPETTLFSEEFQRLTTHAKLLYVFMACKRAGKDEEFKYSYKDMRKDTGYKFNTIARCIRQLTAEGFMKYEHGGLEVSNNIYYLYPHWLEL